MNRPGFILCAVCFVAGAASHPVISDLFNFLKYFTGYNDSFSTTKHTVYKNVNSNIFDLLMTRFDVPAEDLGKLSFYTRFEYFPFDASESESGFLEVIFPFYSGARGASGNGDIIVFHYRHGERREIGEMGGAEVEADLTTRPTSLNVLWHLSAFEYIEHRYEVRDGKYVCIWVKRSGEKFDGATGC